jgi:hypothetical protein
MATIVTSTGSTTCPRCGGATSATKSGMRMCTCSDLTNAVNKQSKVCTACGADVTGKPRMKDSQGKYWCIPCGEEDRRKKGKGDSVETGCPSCKKMVPAVTLMKLDGRFVCPPCYKKAQSVKGSSGGSGEAAAGGANKAKLVMAVGFIVAAVALGWWLM